VSSPTAIGFAMPAIDYPASLERPNHRKIDMIEVRPRNTILRRR